MRALIIVFLCYLAILTGCKEQKTPVFVLEHPFDFELPGGLSTFQRYSKVFRVRSALSTSLQSNKLSLEQIDQILPHDMWLETVDADIYNYGNFSEINIYIIDSNNPSKRIEIGYVQPSVNEKGRIIRLLPGTANVLKYMKEDYFNIEIVLTLRTISVYTKQHMFLKFSGFTK